ncbi:uncharacterized protein L201_004078 [Kwoniella dendrophila CBS 6074]|uniref:Uncharacterized protein n=1 Tax=Kwoniella dendrophila CBS 6074 TaxID=1295534 RepID=A0AAX4JXA1_9TREE
MTNPLTEDDFTDIVKVSPPSSSASLFSRDPINEQTIKAENSSSASVASDRSSNVHGSSAHHVSQAILPTIETDIKPTIPSTPSKPAHQQHIKFDLKESQRFPNPIKKEVKSDSQVLKDVHGVVEDTVRRVRQQSDKLQSAAQPYADRTRTFAETNPVLFTFIALWVVFSSIPILMFLGFALASTVFIVSTAIFFSALILIGAILTGAAALIGTIIFGAALLAPVLFVTTILAFGTLTTLLGLFLVHRLYLHISISSSREGLTTTTIGLGIKSWFEETFKRVLSSVPSFKRTKQSNQDINQFSSHGGQSMKWEPVERVKTESNDVLKTPQNNNIQQEKFRSSHLYNERVKGNEDNISETSTSSWTNSTGSEDHETDCSKHGRGHGHSVLSEKIGKGYIVNIPKLDDLHQQPR